MAASCQDNNDIILIDSLTCKQIPSPRPSLQPSTINPSDIYDDDDDLPEGGWGWMIVVSIFLMMTVLFGYVFALAVFFVEWMRYFDASATDISWVMSLCPAVAGLGSPVAGVLCTKFGSRRVAILGSSISFVGSILAVFSQTVIHLYITIGVMTGIGGALVFSPSLVMLGHYFQDRYVIANGIAFCGYGFAQMIIPRLAQFLIEEYGWRGALLIQSGMLGNIFVCATLLRPRVSQKPTPQMKHNNSHRDKANGVEFLSKNDIWTSTTSLHMYDDMWVSSRSTQGLYKGEYYSQARKQKDNKKSSLTIIRTSVVSCITYLKETYGLSALGKSVLYVVTLVCSFAGGVGWFVTNGHLVARAVTIGISRNDAAFLLSVIGIGSFVGRAGHGIIIDKELISRETMFTASFGVTGILSFVNPFMDTFALLCVFAIFFGITHGIANSLVFAMMRLQVKKSEGAAALSFGTLVLALSNTVGGVLAGLIYDLTGSYDISFYFAGTMILSGTLVLAVVFGLSYRKTKQRSLNRKRKMSLAQTQKNYVT